MGRPPISGAPRVSTFGDFTLDLLRGELRRGDQPIRLRPKSFELLVFFVSNPERLLSKTELMDALWPDAHVTEDSLTQCVIEIRKALGDTEQLILKTVPRRGYLFQVAVSGAAVSIPEPATSPLLSGKAPVSRRHLAMIAARVVLLAGVVWLGGQVQNRRWARASIARAAQLAKDARYFDAYDLATRIRSYLPSDPELDKVLPTITDDLNVVTDPPGASVYVRRFGANSTGGNSLRRLVGHTPISHAAIARGGYILSIEKGGYATFERTISSELSRAENSFLVPPALQVSVKLIPSAKANPGMVFVPGGNYTLVSWSRPARASAELDDYWIDRYEVSNREFRQFVQSGGYLKRELWRHPFVDRARTLSWEEAMAQFRDRTGLPGPRGWSNQSFPEGKDNYPVADISWYEAEAYAAFRGKTLPTVFQWEKAARDGKRTHFAGLVFPWGLGRSEPPFGRANFDGAGSKPVDTLPFGMSPYGAYNMAGNVSEWCRNELPDGFAATGGSWKDPAYVYARFSALPGTFSSTTLGFRCARPEGPHEGAEGISTTASDISYTPVPESEYRALARHYEYDQTPVTARIDSVEEAPDWRRERIVFSGANDEPAIAYLYLPRNHHPPYQVIEFVPGDDVFYGRSVPTYIETFLAPYIKSGRAVLGVVLRGFLEREWPKGRVPPEERTVRYRDMVVNWAIDLRRGLDYLQTRQDVDTNRFAYCGVSSGASMYGLIYAAIEPRYRSVILLGGGVRAEMAQFIPEANPFHFAPYIHPPKLMLSGRYDEVMPLKESGEPLYRILREPKRLMLYDGGHFATLETAAPIVNGWLDETLGRVDR
jgi:formylglycine-generating enzyme required for sulfatase activity/DNA-binding winged helix-turn-helix (wHTH) protein